jgi:hypothetical protein
MSLRCDVSNCLAGRANVPSDRTGSENEIMTLLVSNFHVSEVVAIFRDSVCTGRGTATVQVNSFKYKKYYLY